VVDAGCSRLDCYNQLFVGVTGQLLDKLHSLQNAATRLITGARKFDHITPVMRELHWLPVRQSIRFKTAVTSAFMDWLRHICLSTASWRPAVHICNKPTHACCLFRAHGQPTVTGVLLSVDQSRGTVHLWHWDQVTSWRRLSEDSWRHFCLTVLIINYVDSYRDIDSYVTVLPSLPT